MSSPEGPSVLTKEPYLQSMHSLPGTVQNQRIYFHNSSLKVGVIIPILQMSMLREVKLLALGHRANRLAKLELQFGNPAQKLNHRGGRASQKRTGASSG